RYACQLGEAAYAASQRCNLQCGWRTATRYRSAMSENPVCVAPTGDVCGEGAVWHAAHKAVYWTDINRFLIHRFTPADQCVRTWFFDEPVTALTLTDRDEVLTVVLGSRLILWEPATDMRHDHAFHLEGWPKVRLNDARSDPRGSLWVGSMRNNVKSDGSSGAAGGQDGVLFRVSIRTPKSRNGSETSGSRIPWPGARTSVASTSGTRSPILFGSMTTIWPRVRSRTNDRFWRASREACPTDRQSTPKAICGIAVSLAAASFESRQMGKLIAWLRCR